MAAYLIVLVKIKDPTKLQEYSAAAGPTLAAFGGAPVARGKIKEVLAGRYSGDNALVLKFPDAKAAHDWYHSPAYQALIATRDAAMEPIFVVFEEAS